MKVYSTEGGSTFAIHDGDIVSVCHNKNDIDVSGRKLLQSAVKLGGNKLDAFSGLFGFYIKCGFEPVCYIDFNMDYAPDGWNESYGKEPIVFFKYTGKTYNKYTFGEWVNNIPKFDDTNEKSAYDLAYEYRDSKLGDNR